VDRERQQADRERQRLSGAHQQAGRGRGAHDRPDENGADNLWPPFSMRRIAQVLRAGTMSLYWHVANKDHLLDLMIDALMAEVAIPELSGDWRADLQAFARNHRVMLLRHLWVMDFVRGAAAARPQHTAGQRAPPGHLRRHRPGSRQDWRDRLTADGRLPHFVAFLDTNIDPDAEDTREERFEFGLDCVLDGIAARVMQLTGRAPG
jgi:AcrR family transcriptional regulator